MKRSGLSKGRISQFLDADQPFGEKAAQNLASRLRLPANAFLIDANTVPVNPLAVGDVPQTSGATLDLYARRVLPQATAWETLMLGPLEADFSTVMPDNSMAPEIRKGATIVFIAGATPEPGDFVLLADAAGKHYLREFRQVRPGRWEAHAVNPAYLPMDSVEDGLEVLAVFNGVLGRRSSR